MHQFVSKSAAIRADRSLTGTITVGKNGGQLKRNDAHGKS